MRPVPFSEQSLLEALSSRLFPEGARQRGGKSIGEMRSAADLLAFVCARRRRAQEPSQQGAYSLPNPPVPRTSPSPCTRISCFLPLICHPLRSARRQPGGRATGGRATGAELITGGSRTDRETDRKDEAVWNNCAMEVKPT